VDDTTDFGNGLMLRTTARGVERVLQARHWPGRWTPGISREELAAFLRLSGRNCRWVP
jgi:hypothetical protein